MKPKGKLAILVVLFAGVGVLAATAAFDTVEADRTAEVETAGDADALLGLEAGETELASETDDGLLQITLDDDSDGEGLNRDAITTVLPDEGTLFTATNNGADEIEFAIQEFDADGDVDIYFITTEETGEDFEPGLGSEFVDEDDYNLLQDDGENGGSVTLGAGDEFDVGIVFDVGTGFDDDDDVFDGDITITADSTE